MAIKLMRDNKSKEGTHGTFELGGRIWHSMEREDLGNAPFKSCIPQGTYDLIPHVSRKYGHCYIMVNEDLNVYPYENSPGRPDSGRYLCLFVHRGNYAHNFVGCVGASHGYDIEKDMLLSSTRAACEIVNEAVANEGSYELIIEHEFE